MERDSLSIGTPVNVTQGLIIIVLPSNHAHEGRFKAQRCHRALTICIQTRAMCWACYHPEANLRELRRTAKHVHWLHVHVVSVSRVKEILQLLYILGVNVEGRNK